MIEADSKGYKLNISNYLYEINAHHTNFDNLHLHPQQRQEPNGRSIP
jgi:hypothetical protein